MKICTKCKSVKEETDFAFQRKDKNIRQSICKECHNKYSAEDYKKRTQYYIDKAYRNKRIVRDKNKKLIFEYLSIYPCIDCGNSDIRILTFDHTRGKKSKEVSVMVRNGHPWESIEEEILKCDVRCWNCHMLRHVVENGWKYNFADVV